MSCCGEMTAEEEWRMGLVKMVGERRAVVACGFVGESGGRSGGDAWWFG